MGPIVLGIKKRLALGVLVMTCAFSGGNAFADDPTLNKSVHDLFQGKCLQCHGPGGEAEKKFGNILDTDNLLKKPGLIDPLNPEQSKLYKRAASTDPDQVMPPSDSGVAALTDKEKALLKSWLASLKGQASTSSGQPCFSEKQALDLVADDLKKMLAPDRKFMRYFTLGTLYNGGASSADLDNARAALSKVINSLSWHPDLVSPKAIDPNQLVFRIDLRTLGWDSSTWDTIQGANPFTALGAAHPKADFFSQQTGTNVPMARGDWFIANALHGGDPTDSSPFPKDGLYTQILQLPKTETELETTLGVNLAQDIADGKVMRSGFVHSGVSKFNRVIERHDSKFGPYWISYDFNSNVDDHDIRNSPLEFNRNGGEIIFTLPNGTLGYMLVNAKGERINKAPVQIVSDPKRPDQAVENGISCFRCHAQGFLAATDEVGPVSALNASIPADKQAKIQSLYPPAGTFQAQLQKDNKAYKKVLAQIDQLSGSPSRSSNASKDTTTPAIDRFESDVDPKTAACELDTTEKDMIGFITKNLADLNSLAPLAACQTTPRDVFDSKFEEAASLETGGGGGTNSLGQVFKRIPHGTFQMGSPPNEAGRLGDENQHQVTLSKDYEMQSTPVTQAQWQKIMGTNPSAHQNCPNCPVENVSWNDAHEFITKLNQTLHDGHTYRLPTEAEWERAARDNTTTAYPFGDDPGPNNEKLKQVAWFRDNSGGTTHDVGEHANQASANFKLVDMEGNVLQWCEDAYDPNFPKSSTDPQSSSGSDRVMRGGAWGSDALYLRSAFRDNFDLSSRFNFAGFRLVRTSP